MKKAKSDNYGFSGAIIVRKPTKNAENQPKKTEDKKKKPK